MKDFTLLDLVNLDKILTAEYWKLKDERAAMFKKTNNDIYKVPSPKEFDTSALLTKVINKQIDFGLEV